MQKSGRKPSVGEEQKKPEVRLYTTLLVLLAIVAVLIWGYNLFRLKQVEIEGLTRYEEAQFREMLEDSFWMTNTAAFCLRYRWGEKKSIPFIESFDVTYVDTHTVKIRVYEKIVTGCVEIMGEYLYFDKDGIIVESSSVQRTDIPLVVGLEFEEVVLHRRLEISRQSLFSVLLQVTKLLTEYGISVQKLAFDSDYAITLSCGDVTVLLGRRDAYDEQIAALSGVLKVIGGRNGTLDMRNYSKENTDIILK